MQHIGTSKIGKLSAKGIVYPQLRLPPECPDVIGQVADVIETEHKGKRAFLIVPKDSTVLKPSEKVLKPESEIGENDQFYKLQSALETIKLAIFNKDLEELSKIKNDGLGRIRIGDLRRVKAMS